MLAIDRHAWTNRWRSIHPGEKALFVAGLLAADLALPAATVAPQVFSAACLATVLGARVPARAFWAVMAVPGGFLLAGVPALALSVSLDGTGRVLSLSPEGLALAAAVSLRSFAAMACLAFLILTTPLPDLLRLARRLGLPPALVELAYLMHRLVFVVLDRAAAARQAQAARLGYRTLGTSIRSLGLLAGGLFLRSLDRGRRLDLGLAARGYQGEVRVLGPEPALSARRLALALLAVAAVVALAMVQG
ncbi:MAG: cobalt ECF transporter T component CbiQ [Rhodospirillaceae bacterium]